MNRYLKVFTDTRMLTTLLLGFSGGLPLALTGSTLQAWLGSAKVDIATIGLTALIGLPYALKFLWAPLMDNLTPPFLGLRRGWMFSCQLGLFLATVGLAFVDPAQGMVLFSCLAFLVAFFSASQDIVIDAYRTEVIEDEKEVGVGASTYIAGYRVAYNVVGGGLALIMADHFSWTTVYIVMAITNLVGMVTIVLSKEPKVIRKKFTNFKDGVVQPFMEFFQRSGAMEILIFIMVYKLSTLMATALTTNFLMEIGYTKTSIGIVNKGFGFFATIFGTVAGGGLMIRFGLKRSLWIFGVIQSLVGITFCILSRVSGADDAIRHIWLVAIVCMDNFMMGLGTVALTGFMMSFCSKQFTATQYALLTSVMAVARVILIAHAGTLVKLVGWDMFFIGTVPLAIPGLLMLNRFNHWERITSKDISAKLAGFDIGMILLFVGSLICLSSDPIWQLLGLKEIGKDATLIGAFGIVLLVAIGLLRPYFPARFTEQGK